MRLRLLALAALSLAACADPTANEAPRDAANDRALDAADTSRTDVVTPDRAEPTDTQPIDTSADVAADTASDVASDALPDASVDVAVDVPVDTGPVCPPDACGTHGRCDTSSGAVVCACEPGYRGMRCDQCDTGYVTDGRGGCTNSPCDPNPCTQPDRTRCSSGPMGAVCACNPGTHEDARGACVPDVTCTATTCNGHGTCALDGTTLRCTCAADYAGARCDACAPDAHPDGMGGCTRDVCRPSPCTEARRSVCVAAMGVARCDCDAGYHLDGGVCVVDEVCTATRCSGHGSCSVSMGRASCVCATGYAGVTCDACATGFHPDGRGGCTTDPCLPSPCTVARRSVCVAMGATAVCNCDAGYHPDGAGGCTNDPCLPDPCASRGMACRNTAGAAECYTPMCNDSNPCTDDAVVGGRCVNTPRADGSTCTTTACTTGQRCMSGACTGGTPLRCDDGNPCTRDRCDAATGCASSNDDTLVPDDSLACTVDRCAAGRASHTATDALCDDGRYCTGVERCVPGDATADARGCTVSMVPTAPAPATACASYTCDETTRSFVLTARTGMTCDDTIACTTGDTCTAAGLCIGRFVTGCTTPTTCTSTTPLGATVNLPTARVTGTVTLDGAALPRSLTPTQVPSFASSSIYLVARDTGVRHLVSAPAYTYGTSLYGLQSNSDRVDANVPPGVYDLVDSHNLSSSSGNVGRFPTDPYPSIDRVIRTDVVLGVGPNTLDVNLVTARVTGTVTLDGAALPRTLTTLQVPSFASSSIYLVSRDTRVRHLISAPAYTYGTSTYGLQTNSDRVDANLVPGTYDLVVSHNLSSSSGNVGRFPTDPYPSADRVLRTDVVLTAGANALDVNLTTATVTGTVTLDGAALPRTLTPAQVPSFASSSIYLVSRDTQVRHLIAAPAYTYGTSLYGLQSNTDRVDARLTPGTYDLVVSHNLSSSSGNVGRFPTDPYPSADRVLRTDVVLTAGANTLDVNLTTARVTGTVTLDGAALPRTLTPAQVPSFASSSIYLVSRDTRVRHLISAPSYTYGTSLYGLQTNTDRVDANLVPGTYDLVVSHNLSSSSGTVGRFPTDPYPAADRVIRTGVVITAGANALDVNLITARVTGTVTLGGAALPRTLTPAQVPSFASSSIYLLARDTGVRHLVASPAYTYGTSLYGLQTNSDRVDANVVPGLYDLVLSHNLSSSSGTVGRFPTDPYPSGDRVLRTAINVTAGAFALDVDLPAARITGAVTLDGAAVPRTLTPAQVPSFASSSIYLVSRDTGVRHLIGAPSYTYGTSLYGLQTNSDRVDANVVPGTYDLVLSHNLSSSSGNVGRFPTDPYPSADRVLRTCVSVP
jgi:hypothetical protein